MLSYCYFGTMMFEQHDMRAWKEHRGLKYLSTEIEYDQFDHFLRDLSKRLRRRPGRSDGARDPFAVSYIDCEGTSGAVRLPYEIKNLHVAFLVFVDPEDQEQAARHFAQIQERYDTKVNSTLVEKIKIERFDEGRGSFANLVSYVAKFEWLSKGELKIETYRIFPNHVKPLGDYSPSSNMARASRRRPSTSSSWCSDALLALRAGKSLPTTR